MSVTVMGAAASWYIAMLDEFLYLLIVNPHIIISIRTGSQGTQYPSFQLLPGLGGNSGALQPTLPQQKVPIKITQFSVKISPNNTFWGNQVMFLISALQLFKQLRHSLLEKSKIANMIPKYVSVIDFRVISLNFEFQPCSSSNG